MRIATFLIISLISFHERAWAEPRGEEAIALALFEEGRALVAAGNHARACPKFEAAHRLTGWLGIELNLADCYVQIGRTATAWVMFRKAADKAAAAKDPRAVYARTRAAALEPELARITITTAGSIPIELDTVVIGRAELGVALPIDPGEHVITAGTWSRRVTVMSGAQLAVEVPTIASSAAARPTPATPDVTRGRPWLAWSLGGAGAVMIGVSLGLGVAAKLQYDAAVTEHCDARLVCTPQGLADIDSARSRGHTATIVGGAGMVALTAGFVVYFTRRGERQDRHAFSLVPTVSSEMLGIAVGGTL